MPSILIRRGTIIREYGLTKHEVTGLVEDGHLRPVILRKGSRAYYVRAELEALIQSKKQLKT